MPVSVHGVHQIADQDLPQPGEKFSMRRSTEIAKIANNLQHRVLNNIGRTHASSQPLPDSRVRQRGQIATVMLKQRCKFFCLSGPRSIQQLLRQLKAAALTVRFHDTGSHTSHPCFWKMKHFHQAVA
jgi:hypothetical protein